MDHHPNFEDLHQRYQTQAGWTASIRARLYELAGILRSNRVLEIGSGTGVIIEAISSTYGARTYGIDIDPIVTRFARSHDRRTDYSVGDGHVLPFANARFDLTLCHFLFMWVSDPTRMLSEMVRVTKPSGWVMALAEPDYGGRIDYPAELAKLGKHQTEALKSQGSDPLMGRKLRALFSQSGLEDVRVGILGGEWGATYEGEWESEWQTLTQDLIQCHTSTELDAFRELERQAWHDGIRILYVPTFYACGRVKS